MPPVIPTTFEEYIGLVPDYSQKQAYICLRKMGIDYQWQDDLMSHINMTLIRKQTVEKFNLKKRNKEGKKLSDDSVQRLFYSYINVCIWRAACEWSLRYLGGYVKNATVKSGRQENRDALDKASVLPDNDNLHRGSLTWEETAAVQAEAEQRHESALRHLEDKAQVARLREYILTRKSKLRGRRISDVKRKRLVQILDLLMVGYDRHEIADTLDMKGDQAVNFQVMTILRLARELF